MENQVYYIQSLLVDELNRCKGKGNSYIDNYIKEIQDTYKIEQLDKEQPMVVNKEKQKKDQVQEKEVFLYKPYNILSKSSKLKTLEPMFIQDKVDNLDK